MQLERYAPLSDLSRETFEFLSCGPKGTIKKVIQYISISKNFYNLGFGDWDEETQMLRDDIRTNNNDRDKVLATIAFTVFEFMAHHHGAIIFAKGKKERVMRPVATQKGKTCEIIVVKKMRDYRNEPVFMKKAEKAKEFIEKHGLPIAFTKKK